MGLLMVSMIPNRVASVPIPSTSFKTSLSSTNFPAVFIMLINPLSVYGLGGLVKPSLTSIKLLVVYSFSTGGKTSESSLSFSSH